MGDLLMAKGIFFTGSGFNTGKTLFASILAQGLLKKEKKVAYLNVVEIGSRGRSYGSEFCRRLNKANRANLEVSSLYTLRKSFYPHLSFKIQKQHFDYDKVKQTFYQLAEKADLVLVDLPGTPLTPITPFFNTVDLAGDLGLEAVLVVNNDQSSIHYGGMAAEVLFARGVEIKALVLNNTRVIDPLLSGENKRFLSEGLQLELLAEIPYIKGVNVRNLKFPDTYKNWYEFLDKKILNELLAE